MTPAYKFPPELLAQHIAVLGKTGSGKTSTGKLAIEQVVAEGARVCVLDPIKSDWWGLTSSADGKRAGLPFHILGGPRGHVPLHERAGKAIGELVATGGLPLSIIDMADFPPGGQSQFFVDFAAALLRRMRGVVYLVLEEAHLFAPKERSGVGNENMAIHWAKTLATAGRSKGVRLVLVTQRTQALHNALLGSCDTLIAHRLTAPADQAPVVNWLKANVDSATKDRVAGSLSSLKTGQGWICSGEAKLFEQVQFPRIRTYDNTATPTGDGDEQKVHTAAVDVEKLRAAIGDAVKDAEENDPKLLRQRIADLQRQIAAKAPRAPAADAGPMVAALRQELESVTRSRDGLQLVLNGWHERARRVAKVLLEGVGDVAIGTKSPEKLSAAVVRHEVRTSAAKPAPAPAAAGRVEGLRAGAVRILQELAARAPAGYSRPQVGALTQFSHKGGTFTTYLGDLRRGGFIEERGGLVYATETGIRALGDQVPATPTSHDDAMRLWRKALRSGAFAMLEAIVAAGPGGLTREDVAAAVDMTASGGTFTTYLGDLRRNGLITERDKRCTANDILFPTGGRRG